MNLRGLANSATSVINPNIRIVWNRSTGYTTNAAGQRTPTTVVTTVYGNVQGISGEDIKHIDALNLQGVFRSVHMYGNVQGIVRTDGKGGDILEFPEVPGEANKRWKIINVNETWDMWCRVLVSLQLS